MTNSALLEALKTSFRELAEHTAPKCGECRSPYQCCSTMQCELTAEFALETFGVTLERTDHPTLPFLGPQGCIVAPHMRPICSVHVCGQHLLQDDAWSDRYFELRETAGDLLAELDVTKD
jgi:hypothetical protein